MSEKSFDWTMGSSMAVIFHFFSYSILSIVCRDSAFPGPQIGFLQEIVQWLDYHMKGIENNYEEKEIISIYEMYPNVDELHSNVKERKGRWIHTNQIPSFPSIHIQRNSHQFIEQEYENEMKYFLSYRSLDNEFVLDEKCPHEVSLISPEETGLASGNLLHWGCSYGGTDPIDQREDDGRSVYFDSFPLKENLGKKQNLFSQMRKKSVCQKNCLVFLVLC